MSWGNFVPYHIAEQATTLPIGRLVKDDQWPGVGGNDNDALKMAVLSAESKLE